MSKVCQKTFSFKSILAEHLTKHTGRKMICITYMLGRNMGSLIKYQRAFAMNNSLTLYLCHVWNVCQKTLSENVLQIKSYLFTLKKNHIFVICMRKHLLRKIFWVDTFEFILVKSLRKIIWLIVSTKLASNLYVLSFFQLYHWNTVVFLLKSGINHK